jgi:hypothetical protein
LSRNLVDHEIVDGAEFIAARVIDRGALDLVRRNHVARDAAVSNHGNALFDIAKLVYARRRASLLSSIRRFLR